MDVIKKPIARTRLAIQRTRADHGWFDVAFRTFRRYGEDDGPSLSAALTYYTFFSIFPMLLFAAAILGYITFGNESLRARLIESGLQTIPIISDALTPAGLERITESRGSIAITGAVLALYAGSGAIVALGHGLNKINHVTQERPFLVKRLWSLVWLAIFGLAAVVSLGLSVVAGVVPGPAAFLLALAGGLAVNTGIFATAFKFLTAKIQTWREVLPGAVVAAVFFETLKVVGSAYLARGEATRDRFFGTFAAAAALLIASYLIAQVTLLSAEVNAVLAERRAARQSSPATQGGIT